jgi:type IV secretion system protein TrbL
MAECGLLDAPCRAKEMGLEAAADLMDVVIRDITDSVEGAVQTLTTFWVYIPSTMTMGTTGVAGWLNDYLAPFTAIFLSMTLMVGAIKLMFAKDAEPGKELAKGLVQFAIVAVGSMALITIGGQAADSFSIGIIDYSLESGDFGSNLIAMMSLQSGGNPVFGLINSFLIGIIGIPAAWLQAALMILRSIMLPVLAGCMTLSAAFFSSEIGKAWFKKFLIWTIGFLAYKPAASIIYAAGFAMAGGTSIFDQESLTGIALATMNMIMGLVLIIMSILMLPALMRFVIPVSGALSGRGGAGMMFAGAGLGMIAQGAISNGTPGTAAPMGSPQVRSTDAPQGPGGSGATGTVGPSTPGPGGGPGGAGTAGAAGAAGPAGAGAQAAVQAGTQFMQQTKGTVEGSLGEGDK